MAITYYYMNSYSSSGWNDPADMVDGSTSTYAKIQALRSSFSGYGTTTTTADQRCDGNQCSGTSLGLITKVELRYRYATSFSSLDNETSTRSYVNIYPIFNGSSGTLRTVFDRSSFTPTGPTWSSWYDITNDSNHPAWSVDWDDIKNIDVNVYGYCTYTGDTSGVAGGASNEGYSVQLAVTYTPHVASTLSWSAPSDGGYAYRNHILSISGTAANTVAGVKKVQYKIDSGSWVDCTGTTNWSATIAAATLNALSLGTHTIYTQVQRNGDDAWTSTTSRNFVISQLPAQMI